MIQPTQGVTSFINNDHGNTASDRKIAVANNGMILSYAVQGEAPRDLRFATSLQACTARQNDGNVQPVLPGPPVQQRLVTGVPPNLSTRVPPLIIRL